jgi:hypothetical protein
MKRGSSHGLATKSVNTDTALVIDVDFLDVVLDAVGLLFVVPFYEKMKICPYFFAADFRYL